MLGAKGREGAVLQPVHHHVRLRQPNELWQRLLYVQVLDFVELRRGGQAGGVSMCGRLGGAAQRHGGAHLACGVVANVHAVGAAQEGV